MPRPLQLTRAEQDAALQEHTFASLGLTPEERAVVEAFARLWGLIVGGPTTPGLITALAMDIFTKRNQS